MTDKQTGGPAFPMPMTMMTAEHVANEPEFGMTLRDYFAAKAMSVVMPSVVEILQKQPLSKEKTDQLKSGAAAACYGMADAMLAARELD